MLNKTIKITAQIQFEIGNENWAIEVFKFLIHLLFYSKNNSYFTSPLVKILINCPLMKHFQSNFPNRFKF
jgi:hypothetical protein